MSGFTPQALERKLVDLNNSQQSIQTLSLWLIHHRKHHKSIVQTWFSEIKKAKPSRRLTFMYLANDVIQNSRKKGPEYSKEFGAVLKASFEVVAKDSDEKTLSSLDRILSIWENRNIYEVNQINSFKATLNARRNQQTVNEINNTTNNNNISNNNNTNNVNNINNNSNNDLNVKSKDKDKEKDKERDKRSDHHKKDHKSSKESKQLNEKKESKKRSHENSKDIPSKKRSTDESKKSSVISHNETKPKITKVVDKIEKKIIPITPILNTGLNVSPEDLIKHLQQLENSASADAAVRQKIASLPTEVFDATLLDKIRDKGAAERLTKLVEEARSLLAEYNSRLAQELEDRKQISILLSNYTLNQKNALSLAEQKLNEYREKLRKVVQVRNELKSHLQNLPDLSRLPSVTGLAPLPSACDLFNVGRIVNSTGSVTSSVSPNESNASPVDCGTPGSNTSL